MSFKFSLLTIFAISTFAIHNGMAETKKIHLDVFKAPTCGCCNEWIKHMEERGFVTTISHPDNLNALKIDKGISTRYQSCHTGVTKEGYVFEGHVPAKHVRAFLESPPAGSIGLSVPGMPVGSPGMEVGSKFMRYEVILLNADGSKEVFAQVNDKEAQY